MMRRKHFLRSWTLWFNGVLIPVLAAAEVHFELLKSVLGNERYGAALFAVTLVNVALRFKTNAAVGK